MDVLKSLFPDGPLMAWFPCGTKGFEVRLRHLAPGDLRHIRRESTDIVNGEVRLSSARHEMMVFSAAVQDWRGLTADALSELVPGLDLADASALPAGHQFPFSPELLRSLVNHSEEFYRLVDGACVKLAEISRRRREEELKN